MKLEALNATDKGMFRGYKDKVVAAALSAADPFQRWRNQESGCATNTVQPSHDIGPFIADFYLTILALVYSKARIENPESGVYPHHVSK